MRNPHGYATIIDPTFSGGVVQEFDTMTCVHTYCFGSVNMVKSGLTGKLEVMVFKPDGTFYMKECGFCRTCMSPVCPKCAGKPCSNKFAKIDDDELLAYKNQQRFICT